MHYSQLHNTIMLETTDIYDNAIKRVQLMERSSNNTLPNILILGDVDNTALKLQYKTQQTVIGYNPTNKNSTSEQHEIEWIPLDPVSPSTPLLIREAYELIIDNEHYKPEAHLEMATNLLKCLKPRGSYIIKDLPLHQGHTVMSLLGDFAKSSDLSLTFYDTRILESSIKNNSHTIQVILTRNQ